MMIQITSLNEIIGKTVKRVHDANGNFITVFFTDDTYIIFDSQDRYEDPPIVVVQDLNYLDKGSEFIAGIITEAEYKAWVDERAKASAEHAENKEREELARLLKKYGGR